MAGGLAWRERVQRPLAALDASCGAWLGGARVAEGGAAAAAAAAAAALRAGGWSAEGALGELFSAEAYAHVPWLTLAGLRQGQLRSGMLVRYRCMVQDTFDPELYEAVAVCARDEDPYGQVRVLPASHRECVDVPRGLSPLGGGAEDGSALMERLPVYCVPVPGETAWARARRLGSPSPPLAPVPASSSRKRVLAAGHGGGAVADGVEQPKRAFVQDSANDTATECNGGAGAGTGADAVSGSGSDSAGAGAGASTGAATTPPMSTATAAATTTAATSQSLAELRLATPICADSEPGSDGEAALEPACIVKLYEHHQRASVACGAVKINDLIEVVGVLCLDCGYSEAPVLEHQFEALEVTARKPPASLVPRLHCVALAHEASGRLRSGPELPPPRALSASASLDASRERAVSFLARVVLGGDRLAAEVVLLWLHSGVLARAKGEEVLVGKLTLALTRCRRGAARRLGAALRGVLPRCQVLGLRLGELDRAPLAPRKDNDANRLRSGRLQTCARTPLLVDETCVEVGRLGEVGLRNLAALEQLARKQTVSYDFGFYEHEWAADLPLLVVTQARTPLVKGEDCVVPIEGAAQFCPEQEEQEREQDSEQEQELPQAELEAMRAYLAHSLDAAAAPAAEAAFHIPDALCHEIEADFVAMRQRDPTADQARLHLVLNLARLWAKSHGLCALSEQGWRFVVELERARAARVLQASTTAPKARK
jgi:hypothetical protein